MQTLDEYIINKIQELIITKEDQIAKLEEESFSQIFQTLKETDSRFKPIFSEIKSKLAYEKDKNEEYKILINEKKAYINWKLNELVDHRDQQIKEIKKELKILNKDLGLLI